MDEQTLFRSLKNRTASAEEAAVTAWRRESPDNERTYRELAEVLAAASAIEGVTPAATPPDARQLVQAARPRPARGEGQQQGRQGSRRRWRPGLGVSVAAAAVLVVYFGLIGPHSGASGRSDLHADEFATGPREMATLTLRDGTVVRLAPQSRLRLSRGAEARDVVLSGRAFFAVAKDPTRPFRIETPAGRVEVVGTRFDVTTNDDEVQVIVVEGQVTLAAGDGTNAINAGEMGRAVAGTATPAVPVPDVVARIDWMGNFLAFQETPLRDAAGEIERLYGVRIEFTNPDAAVQTITTWFVDQPLEQVLKIFCLVAEARCTAENGLITVAPKWSGDPAIPQTL